MNKLGRPLIFDSPESLQKAIRDYFDDPPLKKVTITKGEKIQTIEVPLITITGLAYHLGFESRQSFYDYENRPDFSYTIKRARLFIENEYESQLQIGNTTGAIFALKNFGWSDKQEIDHTSNGNELKPQIIFTKSADERNPTD